MRQWSVGNGKDGAVVADQSAKTAWVTDARTDMNGNPVQLQQRYSSTESGRVVVQRDGTVLAASLRNIWESKEASLAATPP